MLIVALVLAVIGLAALVTAVVTTNEVVAWVCIAASGLGVLLLIVDAIRERQQRRPALSPIAEADDETTEFVVDDEVMSEEDHPDEVVHDEPEYDTYSDDEPEYPTAAEESAIHVVTEEELEDDETEPDETEPDETEPDETEPGAPAGQR